MTPRTRLLIVLGLLTALSGCAAAPDADQIRLCRVALVALAEPDATLAIDRQMPTGAAPGESSVRITAIERRTNGSNAERTLECRFARGGEATPDALLGLAIDGRPLSEVSLLFLRRFWLGTTEADIADPQPVLILHRAPVVPVALAHGLQSGVAALPSLAIYGLLAAAYALVYGLVGRINLAFGATAAVGGAASIAGLGLVHAAGVPALVAVAVTAAVWAAGLHGVAIARWVFMPLRRATGQQCLVATVGLAFVLEEYVRLAQGPSPPWVTPLRATPIGLAVAPDFIVTLTPLGLTVALTFAAGAVLLLTMMARTQFGRNWRAMADDPTAAALLGVDPGHLFTITFALASALAGAAGAVTVLIYGSFGPGFGAVLGLKALLAAVLGGIGSVPGAMLGAVAITLAESVWSAFFPIEYRDLALFVMLSCLLVARPGGLFGFGDLLPRRV